MTTYQDVRRQVENLTADEQLRLMVRYAIESRTLQDLQDHAVILNFAFSSNQVYVFHGRSQLPR